MVTLPVITATLLGYSALPPFASLSLIMTLAPTLNFDVFIPPFTVMILEAVPSTMRFEPNESWSLIMTFVATRLPFTVMRSRPLKSTFTFTFAFSLI